LAAGITLRVGRFYSGIGYSIPSITRLGFADVPLAYRAFLANRYADDGVQLPGGTADVFVEFGAEWFRGQNYPAGGAANNGQGAASAFVACRGDVATAMPGAAEFRICARRRWAGNPVAIDTAPDAFSGDSQVAIADFVWKWSPHGNATQTISSCRPSMTVRATFRRYGRCEAQTSSC